jgi:acetoin utilization protein AcuB
MSAGMKVSEIMTREVITLFEEDNLERLNTELGVFRYRHLPVVDEGKVVGILSQQDLLRATFANGEGSGPRSLVAPQSRFLEQTFVRDVMHTDVLTVHPEDRVGEAAKRMLQTGFGVLPVVDADGMLVGIVTENDIVRAASDVL